MAPRNVSPSQNDHELLDAALEYAGKGYAVVPLRPRSKKLLRAGLLEGSLSDQEIRRHFSKGINIGLRLGDLSEGLVDIDLDTPEAVALAKVFLPPTEMRHGRRSRPDSHWWYRCSPAPKTERFCAPDGSVLAEIRSTGVYTMVPPSIHPDDEQLGWESNGSPTSLDGAQLRTAVAKLAACALLARSWPKKGTRNEASLALAGLLLRGELPEADALEFMDAALRQAHDEEWQERRQNVLGTVRVLAEGRPATGGPALGKLLGPHGPQVVSLLRQWLGLGRPADGRPSINAGDLDLARVAQIAWDAILQANQPPALFLHGNRLVRLQRSNGHAPTIHGLNQDELRHRLARVAHWYTVKHGVPRPDLPPMHVVRDLLAEPDPPLPILSRVVETPIFAADGTFDTTPGFQANTRVFYAPAPGLVIPPIPSRPSRADRDRARTLIEKDLLGDFPFTEPADLAHSVALLLLPIVRDLIQGPTPLHLIEKPTPGTGGSLLAEALAFPALGRSIPTMTEGQDDDEWRKRLTAKFLEGPSVLLIDNVRRRLESSALAAALTATIYEDRLLGESRMVRVPVQAAWIATGNNPSLSDEIARRTVRIRLDAQMERPWERQQFLHPDLRVWIATHRGDLIWAAGVLVRAWLVRGRRAGTEHLGMFEAWSRTIGGILAIAGFDGFLANQRALYEEEASEAGAWRVFVFRWWDRYGSNSVSVSKLFDLVQGEGIPLGLTGRDEHAQRTSLGIRLVQNRDRQFHAYKITLVGERQGSQRWCLVETRHLRSAQRWSQIRDRGTS